MLAAFYTFGCTQNNYETQKMRELFCDNGHTVIEEGDPDIIIINSCAVTASAEKGAEELARRLRKRYPRAIIALVGCFGEILKGSGARFDYADIILGNDKFDVLISAIKMLRGRTSEVAVAEAVANHIPYKNSAFAFLHIQNGCDCRCSYCVVPRLRGRSAPAPRRRVMDELEHLLSQGYKEVIVAGINIGQYKSGAYELIDLLTEVNAARGLDGIRLCSLEPMSLNEKFIRGLPQITKLRPYFHISLQSGCDKTLSSMKRSYTFEQYYSLIERIRGAVPEAAISTDVIVGFPGESDADFFESCENIAKCQFSDIHIFKYSPREGTAAAGMADQISAHKKAARANVLEGIKMQACYNFNSRFIGSVVRAAIIKRRSEALAEGVTEHNIKITIKNADAGAAGNCTVDIASINDGGNTGYKAEYTANINAEYTAKTANISAEETANMYTGGSAGNYAANFSPKPAGDSSANLAGEYADALVTGLGKGCASLIGEI